MGIGLELWRARIGTFTQPAKSKTRLSVLKLYGVSLCIRTLLFLLLAVYGVETNPGPGHGSQERSAGRGGNSSAFSRGRGRGETGDAPGRSLRSNSLNTQPPSRLSLQSPSCVQPRSSPNVNSNIQTSHTLAQQPLDNWLSGSATVSSPGLFGPSRFQSPSNGMHFANQPDPNITELKNIMLTVQTSVQNMKGKFSDLEKSMKEVKESHERLIESNNEIKEDVKDQTKRVESLETELQASEDKREHLEAQSRRVNLRFYGRQR